MELISHRRPRHLPSVTAALVAASAALSLHAGSSPAPAAAAAPAPEHYSWTGKIAAGKRLRVINPYGDIRARFGGYEGKVEVSAVLQHLSGPAPALQVLHGVSAGELTLTVGYPGKPRGSAAAAAPSAGPGDRADLVIFVPKGTPLYAETLAGTVEAKGLLSDVTARSLKGEIAVRVAGRIDASSERGNITAFLDPGEKAPQRFETLTGDITLYCRDNANLDIGAQTSGEISTDFSLELTRYPSEEPDKRAKVRIGTGGASLAAASKRGRIRLLWLPAVAAQEAPDSD
jgi:hypothetical protein